MRIQSFEDVIAWQKGKDLYTELSFVFKDSKQYFFNDQLFKTTLSITNNIAEGFNRGSDKELRQFLIIARGSCAEVRSMFHIALANKKITISQHSGPTSQTTQISKLLTGFIKKLETGDRRPETTR